MSDPYGEPYPADKRSISRHEHEKAAKWDALRSMDEHDSPSDARIMNQLEYMSDQLAKTQALVRELEDRIESVLLPGYPTGAEVNSPPRKEASALSNIIDERNGDISQLQRRIQQITDRVQL